MSTPIEIVREMQLWRECQGKYSREAVPLVLSMPYHARQAADALAKVLRSAERYTVLEKVHNAPKGDDKWAYWCDGFDAWMPSGETLAELADRLREDSR